MKYMITICVTTSTLMVSIQTHKLNIYIMMWLLENMSVIYNMEFTRAFGSLSHCFKYYN